MDYSNETSNERIREWKYLTGTDFKTLDPENTVVLVAFSPLEVHGPHLPVISDSCEAEGLSLRTCEIMCDRNPNIEFLHLPPVYVSADVLPHRGSLAFSARTVRKVMRDLCRTLAKQGFKHIWVSNFHGGPRHFVSIESELRRANRKYGTEAISIFSLLMSRLTDGGTDLTDTLHDIPGLNREMLEGDNHGGVVETSLLLHLLNQKHVAAYDALPRQTVNTRLADRGEPPLEFKGLKSFIRAFREKLFYYAEETYSGSPSAASKEIGEQILERLATLTAESLMERFEGTRDPKDCMSPLWKFRWLFTNDLAGWTFERAVGFRNPIY